MHNFTFSIHKTAGMVSNINSIPLNYPRAGFNNLEEAKQYAHQMRDGRNFIAIYDWRSGKLVFRLSPSVPLLHSK
jgi:hypothetical protein